MGRQRKTVLVVEDDALNRELLEAVLAAAGYNVVVTEDGETGIEKARRLRPDVILMDLQLPGIDGLEVTRRLRADAATAQIPILAVTAHVKKDDETRCLAAGCDRHVPKPVDTRMLPSVVAEAIAAGGRTPTGAP